jgi:hypothetical protein
MASVSGIKATLEDIPKGFQRVIATFYYPSDPYILYTGV